MEEKRRRRNGRERERERKGRTEFLPASVMNGGCLSSFIFSSLSLSLDNDWTLMEAKWKLIRHCIRSANRQNENFDCLPDIDTHIEKNDD